jgi:protease PrsW
VTFTALGYAFLGGLLPSLIWLYFLLQEDARCPEPKKLIALAFLSGMLAVPLALPFEYFARTQLVAMPIVLIAWACIEELLKYTMAAVFILWRRAIDERPDYVIYMITVALGFAAAENMLFLFTPLSEGNVVMTFFTGNLRFLGATLLHLIASGAVGFLLAFSASYRPKKRIVATVLGLILAIVLHTAFNTLIMNEGASMALTAFFLVWITAVIFFAAFEVLKYFQYRNRPPNTC